MIYFIKNNRKIDIQKHEDLIKALNGTIREFENKSIDLSIKEVAAALDICDRTLDYHGQIGVIKKLKLEKIELLKLQKKEQMVEKIYKLVIDKKIKEQQIFVRDVYEYLGTTYKHLKKNYPDIYKSISDISMESKEEQKVIKRKKIKRAIIGIYNQNGTVNLLLLSQCLGIKKESLDYYKELIRTTISDLEKE